MLRRIAIVAGEASGDILAARLIRALKAQCPNLEFIGIAGAEMQAAGCQSLYPMEALSVMGLWEVLRHLPQLLSIRHGLFREWRNNPPDLFIGVDAPDFNLPLAKRLHALGIPTVHYVSPSVWAWREQRVKKMQGHLDLLLCLFPFEVDFYQHHQVPAVFVGHPLADEIQWCADKVEARTQLGFFQSERLVGILPGSRMGEIGRLFPSFLQAAETLQQRYPDIQFAVPAVHAKAQRLITQLWQQYTPDLSLRILDGQSRLLMQAADYLLLASGTAVLEGMLSGRLMVAAYKVAPLTAWILRTFRLLKVRYVTLPNNLAQEELVPELLQEQVIVDSLVAELEKMFMLPAAEHDYRLRRFDEVRQQLQRNASVSAAQAILTRFNV